MWAVSPLTPHQARRQQRRPRRSYLRRIGTWAPGDILILADTRPDEEHDYLEFETAHVASPVAPAAAQNPGPMAGRHIALDDRVPKADPPEAFEVCLR